MAKDREIVESIELKQVKTELKKLNEELDQRVIERTRELSETNAALKREIVQREAAEERKRSGQEITAYQEQLRALASEIFFVEQRERHKIATALHDQVGQTLAMACVKLGGLRHEVVALSGQIDEIREMITEAIRYFRTLTFELSPPILYELGLEAAVCSLAEHYQKEHGIRIDCLLDRQPKPLSDDMRDLLFQGVRELLVNAIKHARAEKITISCRREGTDIRVVVEDDGAGLDSAAGGSLTAKSQGFGLFSLRERLKYLGGSISIASNPGRGTRVALTAPLAVGLEEEGGAA
jgi:signal transduction histidine kinase